MLPELPLTQEEALRFQEENLAAAVSINMLLMMLMTMMIQVVGVSQSKRSSRVQSRVGSLAPSRSQNIIIMMAKMMILMMRMTSQCTFG